MKRVLNCMACGLGLFLAVVFVLGGGLWSLLGFAWCGVLYVSGELWPNVWRDFWISNARILKTWGML